MTCNPDFWIGFIAGIVCTIIVIVSWCAIYANKKRWEGEDG